MSEIEIYNGDFYKINIAIAISNDSQPHIKIYDMHSELYKITRLNLYKPEYILDETNFRLNKDIMKNIIDIIKDNWSRIISLINYQENMYNMQNDFIWKNIPENFPMPNYYSLL